MTPMPQHASQGNFESVDFVTDASLIADLYPHFRPRTALNKSFIAGPV
jgi:hypothetical protein